MLQFFKVFFPSSSLFLLLLLLLAIFNPLPANAVTTELPPEAQEGLEGLPADHFLNVLEQTLKPTGPGPADASQFNGIIKIGGFSESYKGILEVGNSAVQNLSNIQGTISNNALVINAPQWRDGEFFPGIVWRTQSDNPTKPKMGIWGQMSSAGSKMFFGTGNSDIVGITNTAMTIDQEGKVGIGTTNPESIFHIKKDQAAATNLIVENDSPSGVSTGILFHNINGDRGFFSQNINTADITIGRAYPTAEITLRGGNVGIGTTKPDGRLDVVGSLSLTGSVNFTDPNATDPASGTEYAQFYLDSATKDLRLKTFGGPWNDIVTFKRNGNVGIGTTKPEAKLDVSGLLKAGNGAADKNVLVVMAGSKTFPSSDDTNNNWSTNGAYWAAPMIYRSIRYPNNYSGTFPDNNYGELMLQGTSHGNEYNRGISFITTPNDTTSPAIRMRIDPSGNVGIGTTSPGAKLDVNGNVFVNGTIESKKLMMPGGWGDTSGENVIRPYWWGQPLAFWFYDYGKWNKTMNLGSTGNVAIQGRGDQANETLSVTNGRGGYGATTNLDMSTYAYGSNNPSFRLQIQDDNYGGRVEFQTKERGKMSNVLKPRLVISSDGNVYIPQQLCLKDGCRDNWGGVGGSVSSWWQRSGNSLYPTDTNVNIGIGTTSPAADKKLDVVGDVRISNQLDVVRMSGLEVKTNYITAATNYKYNFIRLNTGSEGYVGIGSNNSSNTIKFYGLTGDNADAYDHTVIAERLFSFNNSSNDHSELLFFKGNDLDTCGGAPLPYGICGDRIRFDTPGSIVFQTGNGYRAYNPSVEGNTVMILNSAGNVGIGTPSPDSKLDVRGGDINVAYSDEKTKIAYETDRIGLDVAELFESEEEVDVGDIVAVSENDRKLKKSSSSYQGTIVGVVSGSPALLFEGSELKLGAKPERFKRGTKPPVALAGRIPIKISLEKGPIKPGDYLTSSSKPGIAMKATEAGMTIGVALEEYNGNGDGVILVFLNLGEKNAGAVIKEFSKKLDQSEKETKGLIHALERRLRMLEHKPLW